MNKTNPTRSASEIVREIMERDPIIRNGLARGLINTRALARYIQVATHEETTFEALVAAIRRYPIKEAVTKRASLGKSIAKLSMKNKITLVLIRNRPELQPSLARFAGELDPVSGDVLRISSTIQTVKVLIDSRNEEKLTSKVPKNDIIYTMRNLAEIAVELNEVLFIPGTYAGIVTEIAVSGVNLLEASSAERPIGGIDAKGKTRFLSHWFFIVDDSEAMRAYQALQKLSQEA
jgi:hypothetical protein